MALTEDTPDHSTLSRTRRRIDVEMHLEVFGRTCWRIVGCCGASGLAISARTLEAGAAMRSIVRR